MDVLIKGIIMSHRLRISTLVLVAGFANPAYAARTIVGNWAPVGASCKELSTIQIGPKSIIGEDFYCQFRTVQRRGLVVTWKGRCTFGDTEERVTVVAKTSGDKLVYRTYRPAHGGGWNGPYKRCK